MKRALFAAALATLTAGAAFAGAGVEGRITVDGPYVRLMPPTQPNTGAFMVLKNADDKDHRLVKAESPAAKVVELHEHVNEGGVNRMRPVKDIEIKARSEAVLKPGGLHVMLIGLVRPLTEGEPVSITLTFEDGSHKLISAPTRRP